MRNILKLKTEKKKGKLFYGWIIVVVMAVANGAGSAMGTVNLGLFVKPMGNDIGMGRAMFGWAQTTRQTTGAITSPIVGKLLDRYGARYLLPLSITIAGFAMVGIGYAAHPWQVVVLFGVMGLFGLGTPAQLLTNVPIAKWFLRLRGRAMSYSSLGNAVGPMFLLPVTQLLISAFGWRHAWAILGIAAIIVVCPLCMLLMRRQPEDMGLKPDGNYSPVQEAGTVYKEEHSWTMRDAVRSSTFWKLAAIFCVVTLGQTTLGVHRIASFADRGIDPQLVSFAISLEAGVAAVSLLIMGRLFEKYPPRVLGSISILIVALAAYLTMQADSVPLMFLATFVFGTSLGGTFMLQNNLWADYYGRRNLGSIRGAVMPIILIASGIGGPAAGYVYDSTGSYNTAWWVAICLLISGALLLTLTGKPKLPIAKSAD